MLGFQQLHPLCRIPLGHPSGCSAGTGPAALQRPGGPGLQILGGHAFAGPAPDLLLGILHGELFFLFLYTIFMGTITDLSFWATEGPAGLLV